MIRYLVSGELIVPTSDSICTVREISFSTLYQNQHQSTEVMYPAVFPQPQSGMIREVPERRTVSQGRDQDPGQEREDGEDPDLVIEDLRTGTGGEEHAQDQENEDRDHPPAATIHQNQQ